MKIFTKGDVLGGCGEIRIEIDVQILKWESSDKIVKIISHTHTSLVGGMVLYCGIIIGSNAHSTINNQDVCAIVV